MPIDWFDAPDYTIARLLIGRGLAAIYLFAFIVALRQFPALLGERGLLPVPAFVRGLGFWQAPSLFLMRYSDGLLRVVAWTGIAVSGAMVLGAGDLLPLPIAMAAWFLLWALYLSIVNVGQSFYSFGWESLLLEAGFLGIFLGNDEIVPQTLVILLFRWLAFRVEFGAGLIKLRGDQCWRDLTCMEYHHETQPLPNPLSWFFHHLPRPIHRIEAVGNFVAQLVLPWGLFLPQPFATVAAALMILTQLYLVVSGNYAWLNWITIVILASGIADPVVGFSGVSVESIPVWFGGFVVALALLIVVLSFYPVRNMASRYQAMNASFDPFHLVNTYGAFGSVSRRRYEVIIEGTADRIPSADSEWREYQFKAKPGDVRRVPPQVAPYHLRLDWLMWFLPLSPMYGESWFVPFLMALLRGDHEVLGLLRHNPFPDAPPVYVRARLYLYRYTSWTEWRRTGAWWTRTPAGDYIGAVRLERHDDEERAAA
jgi:hypothetical protein